MGVRLRAALTALLGFTIFSTHDAVLKILGGSYSAVQILFFVALFSFPPSIFWLLADRTEANLRPKKLLWTGGRALSMLVASISALYAFSNLPLSQVYSLMFTLPLWVTLLSYLLLRERVGWRRLTAVAIGFIGVIVVLRPDEINFTYGHAAALLAALAAGFSSTIIRKIKESERRIVMMLVPFVANFLVMGAALPFVYEPMPLRDLGLIVLVAILSFVALSLMIRAYSLAEASIVAPMQYSQIIWATLFGIFLFQETPTTNTLIGSSIVIFSGLYIVFREQGLQRTETPVLASADHRPHFGFTPRVGDVLRSVAARQAKRAKTKHGR